MNKKIIVLTGPTASGKTNLAIDLAIKLNCSIICADSRIVFKDFDIVSAKPTLEERKGVLHHLIDIKTPLETYSAGDFTKNAKPILDKEETIIISGGSWFYIKSLLDNKELIECPCNFELRNYYETFDNDSLYKELQKLDHKRALEIHPNNKDKIIRSIEMCLYLKKPVSEYIRKDNDNYCPKWFMVDIERQELYNRINARVDSMIDKGLYQEWMNNKEKYPNSKLLNNTIGYSEFSDFEYKEAVDKIKQHTRNFAKRQLTYFNSNKEVVRIKTIEDIIKQLT